MKIFYLFSKNEKIGSKIISWASGLIVKDLEKVPSHMAILIELNNCKETLVFESVLNGGVRIIPFSIWKTHNEICYKLPCDKKLNLSQIFSYINSMWGKSYDWPGIAYFAWRFLLHFTLKKDFPKDNAWQSDNRFFCNELGGKIAGYPNYSMVTPAKMCSDFLKTIPQQPGLKQ